MLLKLYLLFCLTLLSLNVLADRDLFDAVRAGDLAKVEHRLAENPELINAKQGKWNWSLAHVAAKNNKVNMLKSLAQKGLDLNIGDSGGWTALHVAAWFGQYDAAEALLTHDVRISHNAEGHTAYFYAVDKGYPNIVRLFLRNRSFVAALHASRH